MTTEREALPPLPEPRLYCHELIENKQFNPDIEGVWLGCDDLEVVKRSHIEGETGVEILSLFTADQMHAYAKAALAAQVAQATPAQATTLKRGTTGVCSRSLGCKCERDGLGDECIWLVAATPATKAPAIIAARYRNSPAGQWNYTDKDLGNIERDGWREVVYLCDVNAAPATKANPAPGYCPHCKQYSIEEPMRAEATGQAEPVARVRRGIQFDRVDLLVSPETMSDGAPLYTHPPKAAQPLTDEQIGALFSANKQALCAIPGGADHVPTYRLQLVRMIERAHGIGGEGKA